MEWPGVFVTDRFLTIEWWFIDARRPEQTVLRSANVRID